MIWNLLGTISAEKSLNYKNSSDSDFLTIVTLSAMLSKIVVGNNIKIKNIEHYLEHIIIYSIWRFLKLNLSRILLRPMIT